MESAETSDKAPISQPAQGCTSSNRSIFLGWSTPSGCLPPCEVLHWYAAGEITGQSLFSPCYFGSKLQTPHTETEIGHFALNPSGSEIRRPWYGVFPHCLLKSKELPPGGFVTSSASPKPPQQVPGACTCLRSCKTLASPNSLYGNRHQLVKSKARPSSPKSTSLLKLQMETYGGLVLLEWGKSKGRRRTTFRNPRRRIRKEAACFINCLCRELGIGVPLI